MKTTKLLSLLLALLALSTAGLSSCSKDGDDEIAAAQKPTIYSDWFTPPSYSTATIFSQKHFYHNQPVPRIDEAILRNGVVLVYGKLEGYTNTIWPAGQVAPLPLSLNWSAGANSLIDLWSVFITVGNIKIDLVNSGNYYGSIPPKHSFRYIIIPGAEQAAVHFSKGQNQITLKNGARYTTTELQSMSYEEARSLLDIKE